MTSMDQEEELQGLADVLAETLASGTVHGVASDRLRAWLPTASDLRLVLASMPKPPTSFPPQYAMHNLDVGTTAH